MCSVYPCVCFFIRQFLQSVWFSIVYITNLQRVSLCHVLQGDKPSLLQWSSRVASILACRCKLPGLVLLCYLPWHRYRHVGASFQVLLFSATYLDIGTGMSVQASRSCSSLLPTLTSIPACLCKLPGLVLLCYLPWHRYRHVGASFQVLLFSATYLDIDTGMSVQASRSCSSLLHTLTSIPACLCKLPGRVLLCYLPCHRYRHVYASFQVLFFSATYLDTSISCSRHQLLVGSIKIQWCDFLVTMAFCKH